MKATSSYRAISYATYPRAIAACLAATLAVLIDPFFRFSDYRALLHVLQAAGTMKFSVAFALVFLQVVALFYLILLLPRILRTGVLLLCAFVVVVQFSYWLMLGACRRKKLLRLVTSYARRGVGAV